MGCFNFTGFISDLNIKRGEKCVLIPLFKPKKNKKVTTYHKNMYDGEMGICHFSITKDWIPFCLPIYWKYNDYWSLEDIDYKRKDLKYLESILKIEDIIDFIESIGDGWGLNTNAKKSPVLRKLFKLFDFSYVIEHEQVYNHITETKKNSHAEESWLNTNDLKEIWFILVESGKLENKKDAIKSQSKTSHYFDKISQEDLKKYFSNYSKEYEIYKLANQTSEFFVISAKTETNSYEYIFDWKNIYREQSYYHLSNFKKVWEYLGWEPLDISKFEVSLYDKDYEMVKESAILSEDLLDVTKFDSIDSFIETVFEKTLLKESGKYKTVDWNDILNKRFLDENWKFIKYNHPDIEPDEKVYKKLIKLDSFIMLYNFNHLKEKSKSILAFETNPLYLKAIYKNILKNEISSFNQFLLNMRLLNKMFRIPLACTQFWEDELEKNLIKVYTKIINKHNLDLSD